MLDPEEHAGKVALRQIGDRIAQEGDTLSPADVVGDVHAFIDHLERSQFADPVDG